MALASCHVGIVSHRSGRSAIAAAAYRAADKLHNAYDGLTSDYTRKTGVISSGILAPANAPDWASDRETVWNQHQTSQLKRNGELRDDAQLARDVTIALPQELTREQNIELAKAYGRVFVEQGMVVNFSVHDKGDGNPHAHYLLTMRDISEDGFSKKKNGNWDRNEYVIGWRKAYQDITNRYLEMNGFEERICVDSYEKQGVDRIPTVHLGCAAHHMEQSGIPTDRGNINRSIQEANREMESINREIEILKKDIENIKSVDEGIEHYRKASEAVRTATEALGHRLTETGERSFVQQLRSLQEAMQRLCQASELLGRPSAPESPAAPGEPAPLACDRPSLSRQQATPGQEEPVPAVEPEQPSGGDESFHRRPGRNRERETAAGPSVPEPELLRQRKHALEHESEKIREEAGSRSPPHAPSSRHSGERTLAQQRRVALERQGREPPKPDEGTLLHTSSPLHREGRTLAQQRRLARKRQEQEPQKAEEMKTQQTPQPLPRHHERGSLLQQRKIALERKNKDPVSEVYEGQQPPERGDDVRRIAPDDRRESHHEAERGRVHIKQHHKKP